MAARLALIIANSEFDDPRLTRLATPSRDAEALAKVLRDPAIGGFQVAVLLNKPLPVVRREIARLYQRRTKDDLLLLYYSGHGFKDDYGELYLAVQDTENEMLSATALDAVFVQRQLDQSNSQRKVVVLDCCHSGAFLKGGKAVLGSSVGAGDALAGSGYGRVILTASNAVEYAWEGEQLLGAATTSVFTRFLVQGLRTGEADQDQDGHVSLDELYDYVYEQVVTSGHSKQTPQKWAQRVEGQIVIARNPRWAAAPLHSAARTRPAAAPAVAGPPAAPAKTSVRSGLLTALAWGLGWAIGCTSLLYAVHTIIGAIISSVDRSTFWTLGITVASILGGLFSGRYLRRTRLRHRWLLAPLSWAAGWAIGGLVTLSFRLDFHLIGAALGGIIVSGLTLEPSDLSRLRQLANRLGGGRMWILGRLAVIALMTLGFFSPWAQLKGCEGQQEPPEPLRGVDLAALLLFVLAPATVPALLLWLTTLLVACVRRIRQNEVAKWLERIWAVTTPIAFAAMLVNARESVESLLWGFFVTAAGILLAPLNLLGEWLSARRQKRS